MKVFLIPLLLFATILCPAQQATSVTVRFINGTNGKPIKDKAVNIRLGSEKVSWRDTDSQGQIILDVGSARPRELAIGPDFVFDCRSTQNSNVTMAHAKYSLEEIITKGIVGDNLCGTASASPTPGSLILFVRPRTSKEKRDL
jgi:hypothetical protein